MILKKIYSEPANLFREVTFGRGVNIVYANKLKKNSETNGTGKSLLLNLIDFCLLSDSKTKHISHLTEKLDNAKQYSIVLEFSIDGIDYVIKRSLGNPKNDIIFGKIGEILNSYDINFKQLKDSELHKILCDLIFKREEYEGYYSNEWLRKLIPFFIKKQENPETVVKFTNPISYIEHTPEIIQYHLFFLNFNNSFFCENFKLQERKNRLDGTVRDITNYLYSNFGVKDFSEVENKLEDLRIEKDKLEENINSLNLGKSYEDAHTSFDTVNKEIKKLVIQNHIDQNRLDSYKDSIQQSIKLSTGRIDKLYSEVNQLLLGQIEKTLDDAKKFREHLGESRKNFLRNEIIKLENEILKRKKIILDLEYEGENLNKFLKANEFISDLNEAHNLLTNKKVSIGKIESQTKIYKDLSFELSDLSTQLNKIFTDIIKYLHSKDDDISKIRRLLKTIYNHIYERETKEVDLIFQPNNNKKGKIDIGVQVPKELSKGKNAGKVLLYDLMILTKSVEEGFKLPRFLIHDGIFDGVDQTQFIKTCSYIENLSEKYDVQYIVTINEGGDLDSEKFGESKYGTSKGIEKEAIIILSSDNNLFGGQEW